MEYEKNARLYPVLVSTIPLCSAMSYLGVNQFSSQWIELGKVAAILTGFFSTGLLTALLAWFLQDLFRVTSKFLVQDIFYKSDGTSFPTTTMLLCSSKDLSEQYKQQIAKKVKERFQLVFLSAEEELRNPSEAKMIIRDAVERMRELTRDNQTLLARNIEYGMARNAIGGCVYALPLLLSLLFLSGGDRFIWLIFTLQVLQFVWWLISLHMRAREYAKALFVAFLAMP